MTFENVPTVVSYSDGEGEGAGVGIALWMPNGSSIAGYIQIPESVRAIWSRSATCGEHYDIYEIEVVGPFLVLHNFGHCMPEGSLWIHFIDNEAALATLVKGSSSVRSGKVITSTPTHWSRSPVFGFGSTEWQARIIT